MHAWKIASSVLKPPSRSACRAKSIIIIAFFFTMPISSTIPMIEMTFRSSLNSISAIIAPTLAEGSVERMVIGCTRLSYKTPRTIKMARIAVTTRSGSVPRDC